MSRLDSPSTSRTPETEAAYLRRALLFEVRTAREIGVRDPKPQEVAAHAIRLRAGWTKASWRQIRAALIFRFEAMQTEAGLEAAELLRAEPQGACARTSSRTSGRRAKSVSPEALNAVICAVRASSSKYSETLATWLTLGAALGLRPHEWCQASVIQAKPLDIGDLNVYGADGATAQPYLRVRNAKNTNGRSHGTFRHIALAGFSKAYVNTILRFAESMGSESAGGTYATTYTSCLKLLARTNYKMHGTDSRRWVHLYSARHRFSSEAKAALDAVGVATLMGHETTGTAARHYGPRRSAVGDTFSVRPIASEMARVHSAPTFQHATTKSKPKL